MKPGETMTKNNQKEKSQSKFQIIFMVILIPAFFAVILAVVLLYYLGFDVGETVKNASSALPFISAEEEELEDGEERLTDEESIAQLDHENQSYLQQIQQLENQLVTAETELETLQEELLTLQSDEVDLDDEELDEITVDVNDVVKTLEEMTASKAADIISELPEDEAVTYLRMMNVRNRSDILGRVEAETAAELLSQMSN
jgi:flagellar motility protein MotE (MotC chaperone)